jgi:hypothetical protein
LCIMLAGTLLEGIVPTDIIKIFIMVKVKLFE